MYWFLLLLRLVVTADEVPPGASRTSGLAVTADGGQLIVANPDSGSVSIVDVANRRVVSEIATGGVPQTLFLAPNGRLLVATRDKLRAVDMAAGRVVATVAAGADVFGVVADTDRVYVSASMSGEVRVFELETLREVGRVKTEVAPRGLVLQGERLYVTHFRSGALTVLRTDTLQIEKVIRLGPDHNLAQGLFLDAAGGRLYLPRTRSNSANTALLFDTTVFPIVDVVDTGTQQQAFGERVFVDIADRPVNMPLDAVVGPGRRLYVVNAGSDDVSVIDLATRRAAANIPVGNNPRYAAVSPDGRTVYVNNTLAGTISFIDTSTNTVTATVKSTAIPLRDDVLLGKILFHTSARASLAKDRWISCATCHFDGGADGLTWFFRDGPRNTPPLFGVAGTLPMHWSGDLDELHDVEETVRTIQAGHGLITGHSGCTPACNAGPPNAGRSADLDALSEFMRTLPSPPVTIDIDTAAALRGAAVFARANCAACHPAPLFTDRAKHDVGTGQGPLERKGFSFDTPSLRGIYDTAPYFHDGSAATLREAVLRHATPPALTEDELGDLVEYLRAIPFPAAKRRAAR